MLTSSYIGVFNIMPRGIILHTADNVATLIDPARDGQTCTLQGEVAGQVIARQSIAFGHKICIAPIPLAANVLKYGQVIGRATRAIAAGEHAHVHNVDSARARGDRQERQEAGPSARHFSAFGAGTVPPACATGSPSSL